MREPRFPAVDRGAGHYESYFVKAHHPTEPEGVLAAPHRAPAAGRAADRVAVADAVRRRREPKVTAGKQTFAGARVPAGGYIAVGDATLDRQGGRARSRARR
jgi:hypothetical protein